MIQGISQDSRRIRPGYIFYARQGEITSGIRFLQDAKERGAVMVIIPEGMTPPENILPGIRILDSQSNFIRLSHLLFQSPSHRIKLIGITGTNGKTSTVHFIKSIIETGGNKCGLISTIGYHDGSQPLNAHLTTPDIDYVCQLLNDMILNGCQYAVMEVSSHALKLGRVEGLLFSAAGYTHLTQDHLDFHHTMEEYAKAKARLFEMLHPDSPALINVDCPWSKMMIDACRGRTITYGRKNGVLRCKTIKSTLNGSQFELTWDKEYWSGLTLRYPKSLKVTTSIIGEYQGENIACAAGICWELGIDQQAIQEGIRNLQNIPGRMEKVSMPELNTRKEELRLPTVLVDYSHTPDALRRALENLRKLTPHHLTVIFGCGGDRDPSKRPLMGMIAAELADRVIITSDNPRTETPETICEAIYQ
ncbi:MAG: UDP-N-acetylmuramoyl-L-alanyl-D-glutamate--2,6-diaminopimelate ligase, partial [bacterium]